MSALLFVLGIVLIVVAIGDALWTTIMATGGGPWTSLVTRMVLATVTRVPAGRRRLMPMVGGIMLLKVVLSWIVLLWIGWWLLLCSDTCTPSVTWPTRCCTTSAGEARPNRWR